MSNNVCRSCGAKIRWARTEKGRRMPVDAEIVYGGNIILQPQPHDVPTAIYAKPDPAIKRFVSHFVTCRDHRKWRKKNHSTGRNH
jgi:hypothetical protein